MWATWKAQLGQRPDLPTYVGGWLACISWLFVVGYTVGDAGFNALIYVLTTAGFAVSFWLRGHADGPLWPTIRRAVVMPSVMLRLCFMLCGVVPGLLGKAPFSQLVPDVANGSEEWLIGTGFMWAMALYSFGLVSDGMIAFASVLGLSMLGLMASSNINPEVGVAFLTFLTGNVLMLSNMTLANHTPRRRTAPAGRALSRWVGDQMIVACLTVSITAFLGIGLGYLLQRVSPRGLTAPQLKLADRLLHGGVPASSFAAFSDQMVIGVGSTPNSEQEVFRARVDTPQLWRRRVYDRFTGRVWSASPGGSSAEKVDSASRSVSIRANLDKLQGLKSSRQVLAQLTFYREGDLVAPALLTKIQFEPAREVEGRVDVDRYGNVLLATHEGQSLTLTSQVPPEDAATLRTASADYQNWSYYLFVPKSSRTSVADLAERFKEGHEHPYDTAAAIQQWLQTEFTYDSTIQVPESARDAMAYFFEQKRGACDMIATAMALLARAAGIPARVAVGYDAGELQPDGTRLVRLRNAHAWAELYFEGFGWVPFNPRVPGIDPGTQQALEDARLRGQASRRNVVIGCWLLLAAWLSVYGWRHWRLAQPSFTPTPEGLLARSWHEAARLLARRRQVRRPSETSAEYLRRLQHSVPTAPWLPAFAELTQLFQKARYGLGETDEDDGQRAAWQLAELRRQLRRWRPPRG